MDIKEARALAKRIHAKLRQNHITIHPNGRVFIKRHGVLSMNVTHQHRALIHHDGNNVMLYVGFNRNYWPIRRVTKNTLYFYSRPTYNYYAKLFNVPHNAPVRLRFLGKPLNLITAVAWELDTKPTTDLYELTQNMQGKPAHCHTFTA